MEHQKQMNSTERIKLAVAPVPKLLEVNVSDDGTLEFSGYEGKFLQIIVTALGLKYDIVIPEDKEWGHLQPDGNWTGMIQTIVKEEADVAFAGLSIIEDRWEVVKFSRSYTMFETCLISLKSGSIKSTSAFLYPLHLATWTFLFIVLVTMSILFAKLQNKRYSACDAFFNFFASIIRQLLLFGQSKLKMNILIVFRLLFALVMCSSYSATLLSFLMEPLRRTPIRSIRELSEAVQRGMHRAFADAFILSFLLRSSEEYVARLGVIIIKSNNWIFEKLEMATMKYITDDSSQFLTKTMAELYFGTQSDVYISNEAFYARPVALAYSNRFCCASKLNWVLSKLSNSGICIKCSKFKLSCDNFENKSSYAQMSE
ncbi:uncharacterized protein NPIL_256741 [Nephila pilipes]|uniref:Ionotropic glutamate receptor L-glutamate and glycine-binding domain-containing protein n=1 Tax=Nephila pilipes TaxID=299642 RepID=A0A8X6QP04_NEPPI|nr:uncharacterized protein NPIL_256741 [Nephila pilipes]